MVSFLTSISRRIIWAVGSVLIRPRHRQVAALVWRYDPNGEVEILTITTRRTGRWSIPKGWPIKNMTSAEAAAQEAWEEAGVRGRIAPETLGAFTYIKAGAKNRPQMRMIASVYALHLSELHDEYPEAGQRKRAWHNPDTAAGLVQEADLKAIIQRFEP